MFVFTRGFAAMVPDKRDTVSCGKRYRLLTSGVQGVNEGCFGVGWRVFRGELCRKRSEMPLEENNN